MFVFRRRERKKNSRIQRPRFLNYFQFQIQKFYQQSNDYIFVFWGRERKKNSKIQRQRFLIYFQFQIQKFYQQSNNDYIFLYSQEKKGKRIQEFKDKDS